MNTVTLTEFQRLTNLPDSALTYLLRMNLLPCSISPNNGIEIDVDAVPVKTLIEGLVSDSKNCFTSYRALIEEDLAQMIARRLEAIVQEAVDKIAAYKR